MNTSKKSHRFLGRSEISVGQMENLLEDFANAPTSLAPDQKGLTDESIKRLIIKYPEFFESLQFKSVQGWLLVAQVQDSLRAAWDAPDLRRQERFIFQARRSYHWSTVIDPIETAMLNTGDERILQKLRSELAAARCAVPTLSPFERVAYHFHRIAERARQCANPECPRPYFFASKKGQKYCQFEMFGSVAARSEAPLVERKPRQERRPAMNAKRRKLEGTAYHEAGHAVAAFFLHLKIGRRGVTIIPDKIKDTLGTAHVLQSLCENPDISISPSTHVRIEDYALMSLAGDAAQKKFNPHCRFGGQKGPAGRGCPAQLHLRLERDSHRTFEDCSTASLHPGG